MMGFTKLFRLVVRARIFMIFAVLVAVVSSLSPTFLTRENLVNVLRQVSVDALMVFGMTFLMVGGAFDLSIGSVMAFAGILAVSLQSRGILFACLVALFISAMIGLANGLLVTKVKVNAFIATLGSMIAVRGIAMAYTNGFPVVCENEAFKLLGEGWLGPVPMPVVVMAVALVLSHVVLSQTRLGRSIYAIGGNEEASRLSGIPVDFHKTITFVICALSAGLAGVILSSRLNCGSPILGQTTALTVIAAVVLGGVSLTGGEGNVLGTFVGVLVLGVLANSMTLLNVFVYHQLAIQGAILIGVVVLDAFYASRRRRERRIVARQGQSTATKAVVR